MSSVVYAANLLGMSYNRTRNVILENHFADLSSGKLQIAPENLEILCKKYHVPYVAETPVDMLANPFEPAELTNREELFCRKDIMAHMPFFGGMLNDQEVFHRTILFGKWRARVRSGSRLYVLADWMYPDNWASFAETNSRSVAQALTKAVQGFKGAARRKQVLDMLLNKAYGWTRCQFEHRIGIKRALGSLKPDEFAQEYEGAKQSYYAQNWKHKDLKEYFGELEAWTPKAS